MIAGEKKPGAALESHRHASGCQARNAVAVSTCLSYPPASAQEFRGELPSPDMAAGAKTFAKSKSQR